MPDSNKDKSLKILMIACVPFFSPRGTPISIRSRLKALSELGHEVDLITYPLGEDVELPGLRIFRTLNIPFTKEIPLGPSFKKLIFNMLVFFSTSRFLMRNKYDIIHTHEEASYFGAVFSKIFKVRHLYDFHASLPQVMNNFGYEHYKPLIRLFEFSERKIVNSSNGMIVISSVLERHVAHLNSKVPRVVIENFQYYNLESQANGPSDAFKHFRSEIDGNKIILYSGTFELYQGLELLLDAAELVIEKKDDTVFVLAGGSKSQIRDLKESAARRGIDSRVRFTGKLPLNEVSDYINISNVLVSTRTIGDNPPLKIYDYLKAGKPIVATNILAHTQILNDDIAVLVDARPESIADGIVRVLDDPSYASKLALRSKKFVEQNYSVQKNIEKTGEILDLIMKESI